MAQMQVQAFTRVAITVYMDTPSGEYPSTSSQDRADILSVLANEIFSWTSLDKQEEARIPETHYPHGELILPYLSCLLFLAFTYIIEKRYLVALNSSPVNGRKN